MRPLRLIITIAVTLSTILLLSFLAAKRTVHTTSPTQGRFKALFDWRSPSSLFPPSAIISLTDDNSTFFLARPANFGPILPSSGLSGQLWIGTGFGDDDLSRGGVAGAEGELGCSDVPEFSQGPRFTANRHDHFDRQEEPMTPSESTQTPEGAISARRRAASKQPAKVIIDIPSEQDGTDDHLHRTTSQGQPAKVGNQGHADIQSIQESAEIAGKVVLLTRGGCGFLEKVKWVQRRGGTALIVGDNIRGGPLVTMYARGDTSNVTIPALFTSHTTAHLLSSLVPSGLFPADISSEELKKLNLVLEKTATKMEAKFKSDHTQNRDQENTGSMAKQSKDAAVKPASKGWLRRLFSSSPKQTDRSRASKDARGWVLQEDFAAFDKDSNMPGSRRLSHGNAAEKKSSTAKGASDGFVIGVQDWRDPDLVNVITKKVLNPGTSVKGNDGIATNTPAPTGGSITPGSGDYSAKGSIRSGNTPESKQATDDDSENANAQDQATESSGWFSRLHGSAEDEESEVASPDSQIPDAAKSQTSAKKADSSRARLHEGLWVTLQPTTVSSSPFFDTLLVLVVSPLVTLTVVYALLLLRSRIRRRRWRAPKSVVDRLPVRTYHTIASSSATTSSAQVSPPGTPPSPNSTTPLLHSHARPIAQRPRSRTAGDAPLAGSSSADPVSSLGQLQEKRESGLMEWRRKYVGKQRECVVCLEEYVDGVSRVMSLPCGHEFHAECITPWLTTRRRTCPICKGDVVRSMARSAGTTQSSSSAAHDDLYDDDEHDDDAREDTLAEQEEGLMGNDDLQRAAVRSDQDR